MKPKHIAIILDGNGRWATQKGLKRKEGHKAGVETVKKILTHCADIGIEKLTVFAFSTENWKRPADEVNAIFNIITSFSSNDDKRIKVKFVGEIDKLPSPVKFKIRNIENESENNQGIVFSIALNYGSRADIVNAAKYFAKNHIEKFSEEDFKNQLSTSQLGDVDLLIRTGGELRISNFLLFESAYAELYFSNILWPDFTEKDLDDAIENYEARNRRFGGLDK